MSLISPSRLSLHTVAQLCTSHTFDRQRSTVVSVVLVAVPKAYGELLELFLSSNGTGCVRVPCALCHGGMPLASGCGPDSLAARDGAPLRSLIPAKRPGTRGDFSHPYRKASINCPSALLEIA